MKIAIDCRYMGMSGIGRVSEGLLDNLDYGQHEYYLIGKPERLEKYERAVLVSDDTNPFSRRGLFSFQKKIVNQLCDCILIPNFIIPLGIKVPVHIVMHDLIFLDVKATVNGKIDYFIKKYLLKRGMKRSKSIACVSEFTKSRCEYYFPQYAKKCYVNYNGLSKDIIAYKKLHPDCEKENVIVYVGNIKPHKGLITLLNAFSKIQEKDPSLKLKIIGEKEGFLTGMDLDEANYPNVVFTGRLESEELFAQIQKAKFLIQPSLYEGFGLPPLEALYLGTQPIISDIPVFREIYSDLPVKFFENEEELCHAVLERDTLEQCAEKITQKFDFRVFADRILNYICG